ncbi:MAG: hypothetical protein OXG04_07240 [Acidobacteria bacterium]|nr:hypothetical protein [Acidobacteriota bacterium]
MKIIGILHQAVRITATIAQPPAFAGRQHRVAVVEHGTGTVALVRRAAITERRFVRREWRASLFRLVRKSKPARSVAAVTRRAEAHAEDPRQVKTDLNGSPKDYDRDALAPALVAVPGDDATTAAPEARTRHTGDPSR